jgi:hypothetical protein
MRAHTEGKDKLGKRFAIVIGVAAAGVMALGAQTASSTTGDPVDSTPPDLQLSGKKKQNLGQPLPTRGCLEHGRCPKNVQVEASCEHERVDGRPDLVAPGEGCTVSAEGKLTKVKNDKLKPTRVLGSADLWPGDGCSVVPVATPCTATLALKLTKKTYKQVRKALDNGKKVQAKVTVEATDAAGNEATAKRTIKLVK